MVVAFLSLSAAALLSPSPAQAGTYKVYVCNSTAGNVNNVFTPSASTGAVARNMRALAGCDYKWQPDPNYKGLGIDLAKSQESSVYPQTWDTGYQTATAPGAAKINAITGWVSGCTDPVPVGGHGCKYWAGGILDANNTPVGNGLPFMWWPYWIDGAHNTAMGLDTTQIKLALFCKKTGNGGYGCQKRLREPLESGTGPTGPGYGMTNIIMTLNDPSPPGIGWAGNVDSFNGGWLTGVKQVAAGLGDSESGVQNQHIELFKEKEVKGEWESVSDEDNNQGCNNTLMTQGPTGSGVAFSEAPNNDFDFGTYNDGSYQLRAKGTNCANDVSAIITEDLKIDNTPPTEPTALQQYDLTEGNFPVDPGNPLAAPAPEWAAGLACPAVGACGETDRQRKTDFSQYNGNFRIKDTAPGAGDGSPISANRDLQFCLLDKDGKVTSDCRVVPNQPRTDEIRTPGFGRIGVPGDGRWQLQTRYGDALHTGAWNGSNVVGAAPQGPVPQLDTSVPPQPVLPFGGKWLNQAALDAKQFRINEGADPGVSGTSFFKYMYLDPENPVPPTADAVDAQGSRVDAESNGDAFPAFTNLPEGEDVSMASVAFSGARKRGNAIGIGRVRKDTVDPVTNLAGVAPSSSPSAPIGTTVRPLLTVQDATSGAPFCADPLLNGCGFIETQLDGDASQIDAGNTVTLPNAGEEDHSLRYRSRDGAENFSPWTTINWTQDTVLPEGTISSPTAGSIVTQVDNERCLRSGAISIQRSGESSWTPIGADLTGSVPVKNWSLSSSLPKTWTNGNASGSAQVRLTDCAAPANVSTTVGAFTLDACSETFLNSSPGIISWAVAANICNSSRTVDQSRDAVTWNSVPQASTDGAGTTSAILPRTWTNGDAAAHARFTPTDTSGRSQVFSEPITLLPCPSDAAVTNPLPGSFLLSVGNPECMTGPPVVRMSRTNGLTWNPVSPDATTTQISKTFDPTWIGDDEGAAKLEATFTDTSGQRETIAGDFNLNGCSGTFVDGGIGDAGAISVEAINHPECKSTASFVEVSRNSGDSWTPVAKNETATRVSARLPKTWTGGRATALAKVKLTDSSGITKEFAEPFTLNACEVGDVQAADGAFVVPVNDSSCKAVSSAEISRDNGQSWRSFTTTTSPTEVRGSIPFTWTGALPSAKMRVTMHDGTAGGTEVVPFDLPLLACSNEFSSSSPGRYALTANDPSCLTSVQTSVSKDGVSWVPVATAGELPPSWLGDRVDADVRATMTDSTGQRQTETDTFPLNPCTGEYSNASEGNMAVSVSDARCLASSTVKISRDGGAWTRIPSGQQETSVSASIPPSWVGDRPDVQTQTVLRDNLGSQRTFNGSVTLRGCSSSFSTPSISEVRFDVSDASCLANGRISISRDGTTWLSLSTSDTATSTSATLPADWLDARGTVEIRGRFTDSTGASEASDAAVTLPEWNATQIDVVIDTPGASISNLRKTASVSAAKKCKTGYVLKTKTVKGKKAKVCVKKTATPGPSDPSGPTSLPSDKQLIAKVTTGNGSGANLPVTFQSRTVRTDGEWETLATRQADSRGVARLDLAGGPSREFRVVVAMNQALNLKGDISSTVRMLTPSGLKLSAPKSVKNKEKISFKGQLVGGYIPKGGVRVDLLGYGPKRTWVPIQSQIKTNSKGAFTATYRFTRTVRTTKYQFRARVIAPQVGYPYESGESARIFVTVRK